jgi:F0F1-type ATP synthase membrane subunit c/vacuolar-type H+-ATPase subunit K
MATPERSFRSLLLYILEAGGFGLVASWLHRDYDFAGEIVKWLLYFMEGAVILFALRWIAFAFVASGIRQGSIAGATAEALAAKRRTSESLSGLLRDVDFAIDQIRKGVARNTSCNNPLPILIGRGMGAIEGAAGAGISSSATIRIREIVDDVQFSKGHVEALEFISKTLREVLG